MEKQLTCSVTGKIEGCISFCEYDIENAIKEAIRARDTLGLNIVKINGLGGTPEYFELVLTSEDTPEHFHGLATQAKAMGWL